VSDVHSAARRLAEEVLLPAALEVDRADSVPPGHVVALATAGLYGAAAPTAFGGLGLDATAMARLVETLASGCLATTFVWLQHHGLVRSLSDPATSAALRDRWLGPLVAGRTRAGIALTGLWPGTALLRARPEGTGWIVEGRAPWVSGWGLVDVLQVAARGPDGTVVWLIVDAVAGPSLTARRVRLVAADASRTVDLEFGGLAVPADRHIATRPYDQEGWTAGPALRLNGSLALGVAARCIAVMGAGGPGAGPLDEELALCRSRLDGAGADEMAAARAAASELAWRAAGALVVDRGSRAVRSDDHAQRLAREALFLLVFGTRPSIRAGLLERLTRR